MLHAQIPLKVIGIMQWLPCPDMVYIEVCMGHTLQNSCGDINTVMQTDSRSQFLT